MFLFGELIISPFGKVVFVPLHPSIPLSSYFSSIHLFCRSFSCRKFSSPSFGEMFSCQPFNSVPVHPLGESFSYWPFNSPSFGELFSCRPFNCQSVHPFGELFLRCPSLFGASYFCADHITLNSSFPLASYFCAVHPLAERVIFLPTNDITLHLSILLASYFCVIHPLGELFSCQPCNSPSVHPFGELFSCWILTLHPSIHLKSYFCRQFKSPSLHRYGE